MSVNTDFEFVSYTDESMLPDIQRLVSADLSEPYSVFVYRYFLHQWPQLCICVYNLDSSTKHRKEMIAVIVCKAEDEGGKLKFVACFLKVEILCAYIAV